MLFFFYCLKVFHKFPSLSFIHENIFFMNLLLMSKTLSFILCLSISVGSSLAFSYPYDMIYSRNNSDDNLNYYYTFFFTQMKSYVMCIIYGVPYMIICGYFRTQFINRRLDEKETQSKNFKRSQK